MFLAFCLSFLPHNGRAYLARISAVIAGSSRCLFGPGITFDGVFVSLVIARILQDKAPRRLERGTSVAG